MNRKRFELLFLTCFFSIFALCLYASSVPENVQNIILKSSDFPANVVSNDLSTPRTNRTLFSAGWQKHAEINSGEDVAQGLISSWKISDTMFLYIKYGCFDSPEIAQTAAKSAIFHASPGRIHFWPMGSFSGIQLGDNVFHWELSLEKEIGWHDPEYAGDGAILSFNKGKYAVLINIGDDFANIGNLNKLFIENLGKKCENKMVVATSLDNMPFLWPLITNKGIQNSLQVKIDDFIKNYRQGDYKVALNNISSFVNELEAQRGKHVNESIYQAFKGYADTIVNSLNSLLQK